LALSDPRVAGAAPYVEKEALLNGPRQQPAMVSGVVPADERTVSVIGEKMLEGELESLQPGSFNILLGRELDAWLGVRAGVWVVWTVVAYTYMADGAIRRVKRFTVSGIFEVCYHEYDRGMASGIMAGKQRLLRLDQGATGVRLRLHDMD